MHRKLWSKAPSKESALSQMSKNFQVYFIQIFFLRNQTKKFTIELKSFTHFTALLLYLFFDSSLSTWPKKKKKKNRNSAQGYRLSPRRITVIVRACYE